MDYIGKERKKRKKQQRENLTDTHTQNNVTFFLGKRIAKKERTDIYIYSYIEKKREGEFSFSSRAGCCV